MEWKLCGTGLPDKEIFTTGTAARVCNVSQQTIIRCFDTGLLRGARIPGSKFRRIPREELMHFVRENGIGGSAFSNDLLLVIASLEHETRESFMRSAKRLLRQREPEPEGFYIDSAYDAGAAIQKRIIAYPMAREARVILDEQFQCREKLTALLAQRKDVHLQILNHEEDSCFRDTLLQALTEDCALRR
jgi:excisionase family DNA binding protein